MSEVGFGHEELANLENSLTKPDWPKPLFVMKSILVIDDDFAMRRGIALMLQGEGFQVYDASDGTQALQILTQNAIDLAIVDLFLPGRDGIEVAGEIRKRSPTTKIILLTAYGEHPRAKEARQIFKANYLEKTALVQNLLKTVQKIL